MSRKKQNLTFREPDMYKCNFEMLEQLPQIIGVKNSELARQFDVSQLQMIRYRKQGNMPVKMLVDLCNKYKLRISCFIHTSTFTKPETYVWHSRMKIRWRHDVLKHKIENELSIRETQRILKCAYASIHRWTDSTASIDNIIHVCNELRWNMREFITDVSIPDIEQERSKTQLLHEIMILKMELKKEREANECTPYMNAADKPVTFNKNK